MARDVLQHYLQDQARHRVEVTGERLAAEPKRLERNRASTRERVHHQRRLLRVRGLDEAAADLQVARVAGVVPIGEVPDELQQHGPQPLIGLRELGPTLGPPAHREQQLPRAGLELRWAVLVTGVRQQQPHQYRSARRQRSPGPP